MVQAAGDKTIKRLQAEMAFAKPGDVTTDSHRPGILRACSHAVESDPRQTLDMHSCQLEDWSVPGSNLLDLETMGFDCIDLASLSALQTTLETVRSRGQISPGDASLIRRQLTAKAFTLSRGKRLKLLTIAAEGLIMRRAGPNACKIAADEPMTQMNGHDGALTVHADQDVRGTPLKQMLRGTAPWLFRHQSPDSRNRFSPLFLVNIWIPLQQISRPLSLMDRRTLDNKRQQLCYALPTDKFLERNEGQRVNDIWAFLHNDAQQWYFSADMDATRAYVFDTLGTPHGAVILPGEALAEQCYKQLQKCRQAVENKDLAALHAASIVPVLELPHDTTAPLRRAISTLHALLEQAHTSLQLPNESWCHLADLAIDKLVRKSIEMRAVAILTADRWPFNKL